MLASEQDRPDVARKRRRWRRHQGAIDPHRLVFVDETWTKTNMAPLRGWGPCGERVRDDVPFGRWHTMTFIAGLRCDGIIAPFLFKGPINGACFLAWVERQLAPTLRPGDVVVMDNLGSHKGQGVRDALAAVGARRLFLPPYSPDLNPIEQAFSKLKTLVRKARARTFEHVARAIGKALPAFLATECANYFTNSGYADAMLG